MRSDSLPVRKYFTFTHRPRAAAAARRAPAVGPGAATRVLRRGRAQLQPRHGGDQRGRDQTAGRGGRLFVREDPDTLTRVPRGGGARVLVSNVIRAAGRGRVMLPGVSPEHAWPGPGPAAPLTPATLATAVGHDSDLSPGATKLLRLRRRGAGSGLRPPTCSEIFLEAGTGLVTGGWADLTPPAGGCCCLAKRLAHVEDLR